VLIPLSARATGARATSEARRYNAAVPTVRVDVDKPYDVIVEPGLLARVGPELRRLSRSARVAVVTESNVAPLHLPALHFSLQNAGFEVITATFPAGENNKTIATTSLVYDALLPAKLDRSTPLIALGGGVVGDLAGFAAATILRGVPFVQVPTTLLAMVDASVGGKTGVNHDFGKNLIGAFHQPIAVLIDPEVLKSLPRRELRGGLAECIKHDIIRDVDGFARLEKSIDRALALDVDYLSGLLAHNVAIKAKVVAADPLEKGERAHLNFGHTFGHAIESVSKFDYSHGESVALGMVAASGTAVKLGMINGVERERIVDVIKRAGLPTGGMKLDANQVVDAMWFDKKVASGKLRFVLPDRIGHVVIRDDVPEQVVREAVERLRG
jgi:3-dehydroquinate synthase